MSEKHHLPWHRVINSKGGISLSEEAGFVQGQLLSQEGIPVINKKIDLGKYQYKFN
jgi:methylated-DNA-protein-cysteine methyltransferase-like protein